LGVPDNSIVITNSTSLTWKVNGNGDTIGTSTTSATGTVAKLGITCSSEYSLDTTKKNDYIYTCSSAGQWIADATPGNKTCGIPAYIVYAGTTDGTSGIMFSGLIGNGQQNDCMIDWGDDSTPTTCPTTCTTSTGCAVTHTYASAKDYDIKIYGTKFTGFYFYGNSTYAAKVKKVVSMGKWTNTITSMANAFHGCTILSEVSATAFQYLTDVTTFSYAFYGCTTLTTVPASTFQYSTLVTDFSYLFYNCTNFTTIPANLFKYNTKVTTFYAVFITTGITSIPADTFRYNTLVTDFSLVFYNCTKLTSIPTDLFRYNIKTTTFYHAFVYCYALTAVPTDLFRYNTLVTDFGYLFYGCTSLTSIPTDLFTYNTAVTSFSYAFYGVTALECSIISGAVSGSARWTTYGGIVGSDQTNTRSCAPSTSVYMLYAGTADSNNGIAFSHRNGGQNICTIYWGDNTTTACPATCSSTSGCVVTHTYASAKNYGIRIYGTKLTGFYFDGNLTYGKVKKLYSMGKWDNTITDMYFAFGRTSLDEISADAFKYLTAVTSFNGVFFGTSFKTIPADIFRYNTEVTDFGNVFYRSSLSSIPTDLFRYNTKVRSFNTAFMQAYGITTVPVDIFRYNTLVTDFAYLFYGNTSLTSLPTNLFTYNTAVTSFNYAFNGTTGLSCSAISAAVSGSTRWTTYSGTVSATNTNTLNCK
jgi:hypothetical protein